MHKQKYPEAEPCSHGFTLIEILIVLAVVAILALIALPSYLDVYVRNDINEALPLADIVKAPVADAWASRQAFPADNAAAGLPPPEKIVNNFISAIAIRDGAIHITFGNHANGTIKGKVLTLRPAVVKDAPIVPVTWVCGYASEPGQMTVQGENRTDIPMRYLPLRCRAG
ncbi:MAG TPA: pilin [Burkholderiales bacterium]|nr:pilin [Burkholderiales bacterium]